MIARKVLAERKEQAAELLVLRGFEPVLPVEDCYLAHYTPLHLAGTKGDNEVLCVKLRAVQGVVSTAYVESSCKFEICQFRSLQRIDPGNITLRCEIWVISSTGAVHCYEVLSRGIREVAAFMLGEKIAKVATEKIEGIPLYLIPKIIADEIRKKGEAVLRILVERKFRHNYTILIESLDEPASPAPQADAVHNDGEVHA